MLLPLCHLCLVFHLNLDVSLLSTNFLQLRLDNGRKNVMFVRLVVVAVVALAPGVAQEPLGKAEAVLLHAFRLLAVADDRAVRWLNFQQSFFDLLLNFCSHFNGSFACASLLVPFDLVVELFPFG